MADLFARFRSALTKTRAILTRDLGDAFRPTAAVDVSQLAQLEEALIAADVGPRLASEIVDELESRAERGEITSLAEALEAALAARLVGDPLPPPPPLEVIFAVGVNGVGKTTSLAKLARAAQREGRRPLLAAADTFRAAATEQLEVWGERAGVPVVKAAAGRDPASVVFDALAAARSRQHDLVLVDTAGRLHNKKPLMDELAKLRRIAGREVAGAPHQVLLVLDATTGSNGVAQAREFQEAAGATGVVLTKLDGTAKGGVVLQIRSELGLPVRFIGVGEGIDDLERFDAASFVKALVE